MENEKRINELATIFEVDYDLIVKIIRDGLSLGLNDEDAILGAMMILSALTLKSQPLFAEDIARLVGCQPREAGGILATAKKEGKISFLPEYEKLFKSHLLPFLKSLCEKLEKGRGENGR